MGLEMFEELFMSMFSYMDTPTLIASIVLSVLSAFFGFKYLKLLLVINAFASGYTFGSSTLGLGLKDLIPGFDLSIVVGILCAIIFALIAVKLYKYLVYFLGGYFGFVIGVIISSLTIGLEGVGALICFILSIAFAILFAKLFYGKLFKPFYIISSSFNGMSNAAIYTAFLVSHDFETMILATLIGIPLGIIAMICQFRSCRDLTTEDVL